MTGKRVVIVGAGIAGLIAALEAQAAGCAVTVLERGYPGGGNSGRNVGRIRRMQLTEELTRISIAASDYWQRIDTLLGGRNPLLFPTTYALVLYGDDEAAHLGDLEPMWRAVGIDARLHDSATTLKRIPILQGGERPVGSVLSSAHLVHHDAAVHGAYLAALERGIDVRLGVEALGFDVVGGAVVAVETTTGRIEADAVINAADSKARGLAETAGVSVPTHPMRREALVTHSIKPIMDQAVTFYRPFEGWFNQTLRGEIVAGVTDPDEPAGYNHDSSLQFATRTASLLALKAPSLLGLHAVRQWAGTYEYTPDRSPIVGAYSGVEGFYGLHGWSGRGMLLAPVSAALLVQEIVSGIRDPLMLPFAPQRFDGVEDEAGPHVDYYGGYSSVEAAS
ncbi:MAG: FAD-binding oxidoreductase [Actinobacteria bacterium]|nr:FAD-binding oxidoreductase [Actinomycetota bacterium]